MELNVLAFNIHHGVGMDKKHNLDRIAAVIRYTKADLVGLNEVDNQFSKRSDFFNQAEWLANILDMNFVFGPAISQESDGKVKQYGNALLSRFPIIDSVNHPFDFLPRVVEDRALLEAGIDLGTKKMIAFVSHLSFAPFLHEKQTEFIVDEVGKRKIPCVIMGDWNMKPFSKSWRRVVSRFRDVNGETVQNENTYPSKRPKVKLDYIFTTKEFEVLTTQVVTKDPLASDHLPLFAKLKF